MSGVWTPFARASSRTPRASEPWLRSSSPFSATHWPLYSCPCALSHSSSGIRPRFAPGAEASVIVNRTCCLSRSDKGSSGRRNPSSNIASACCVTISFYRDKSGLSREGLGPPVWPDHAPLVPTIQLRPQARMRRRSQFREIQRSQNVSHKYSIFIFVPRIPKKIRVLNPATTPADP